MRMASKRISIAVTDDPFRPNVLLVIWLIATDGVWFISKNLTCSFEQGEDIVFRVSVLSKGKSSGRNKNYLNVRYSDGSLGGVFINKHQWSFISKSQPEPQTGAGVEKK